MSVFKCVLPVIMLVSFFSSESQAQTQLPLYESSYEVQVKYEMWRNGSTYWATEYETTNSSDAYLVLALFEAALEDGSLGDILGSGFDWIPVDVKLVTKRKWYLTATPTKWAASTTLYSSK